MARKPTSLPDSYDPVEIALDAERHDAAPDSPARTLLLKNIGLIDDQRRHLGLQHANERMSLVLKALTAAAGLVVAAVLGLMAWQASQAKGLVIEAFSVPPDLAAKGVTGQVVAARLLDRLIAIPRAANSVRLAASFKSGWIDDIKLEIPETGVSIGELERYLRRWLGHETVVRGEVTRDGDNLVVTVRTDGDPGTDFTGPAGDLDNLLKKAADKVYGDQQPYLYAIYLNNTGDPQASIVALQRLAAQGHSVADRAWGYSGLANVLQAVGRVPEAAEAARRSQALDAGLGPPIINQEGPESVMGHDDLALALLRRALPVYRGARMRRELNDNARRVVMCRAAADEGRFSGDYAAALAGDRAMTGLGEYSFSLEDAPGNVAFDLAALHEPTASARAMAEGPLAATRPPQQTWEASPQQWAWLVQIRQALVLDDHPALLGNARDLDAWFAANGAYGASRHPTVGLPWLALGLALNGRFEEARAAIAATPTDCYLCLRVRGQVAALSGDRAGADRWFTEAVRQGPSLPFADAEWGQALMARGDTAGALARFRAAAARGPRWADPQELWGEALLAQGDAKAAEARFKAADAFAPRWGRNHLRWGEALMRQGKTADARIQWLSARGMDLSAADRSHLDQLLAGGRR